MADKTTFTPDEWRKLPESPIMAGHAATAADPSGLWGQLKEKLSGRWVLLEAKTSGANELIRAVATDFDTSAGRTAAWEAVRTSLSGRHLAAIRDKAPVSLREVAAIVDAKAPDEAAAFKDWLQEIAQKTAEAATEGGFFGSGDVRVSEAEKVISAEIANALAGSTHSALGASTGSGEAPRSTCREEGDHGQAKADLAAASSCCIRASAKRSWSTKRLKSPFRPAIQSLPSGSRDGWDMIPAAEPSFNERMRVRALRRQARTRRPM